MNNFKGKGSNFIRVVNVVRVDTETWSLPDKPTPRIRNVKSLHLVPSCRLYSAMIKPSVCQSYFGNNPKMRINRTLPSGQHLDNTSICIY
jgi:hypothetical protein